MTLIFPDPETLRLVLSSDLVPSVVTLAPVRTGSTHDGGIWLELTQPLPKTAAAAVRRLGVLVESRVNGEGIDVEHWLQALPIIRDSKSVEISSQTTVLFEVNKSESLRELVLEMLRLGNDRQGFRQLDGMSLLKVTGPPYYSLLSALDHTLDDRPHAFTERSPRIWVEMGYSHPLESAIKPAEGRILLLQPPNRWTTLEQKPFTDIYDILEFQLPSSPTVWKEAKSNEKFVVPLRLTAGGAAAEPELWVLPHDRIQLLDDLVRDADDRLLNRISFAIGEDQGQRVAVLRVRPGKGKPPVVVLPDAIAFRPHLKLQNLFVPIGQSLHPPLRRESVRTLLANDPAQVTWLTPLKDGEFVPESLPDDAFRPLEAWVDYILDRDRAALNAWAAAARFDFAEFICPDDVPAGAKPTPPSRPKTPDQSPVAAPRAVPEKQKSAGAPKPSDVPPQSQFAPNELQIQLTKLEEQFVAETGHLDSPGRMALWPLMAHLNTKLRQPGEAALCLLHACWDQTESRKDLFWTWVEAERALSKRELTESDLERLMANATPTFPDIRAFAAAIVWAAHQSPVPAALANRLVAVRDYLERHDSLLPVRAVWVIWVSLARIGGDVLSLVRVRDRVLARLLERGLSPELDLPTFLRFSGRGDGERLRQLRDWVDRIHRQIHEWYRNSRGADSTGTAMLIDLYFAFGLAKLGETSGTGLLLDAAKRRFEDLNDDTREGHALLAESMRYRIEQSSMGKPHSGPLPANLLEYLAEIQRETAAIPRDHTTRRLAPYAVNKLRETSRIVDPHEKFDAYRNIRNEKNELVAEAILLPDEPDAGKLGQRITDLVRRSGKGAVPAEVRIRILAETTALCSRLPAQLTSSLLEQVIPALDSAAAVEDYGSIEFRMKLLDRTLFFAAHVDRADIVQSAVDRLLSLLKLRTTRLVLEQMGGVIGQTLISLRKLGLKDDIIRLLGQIQSAILEDQPIATYRFQNPKVWPGTVSSLLHVAAGWLHFDRPDKANPILDAARLLLFRDLSAPSAERPAAKIYPSLVCNYIAAVGHLPVRDAEQRIEELFAQGRMDSIPNTMTTQPYYSVFHLNIVESVVWTFIQDDFALGPAARRWLDEDEILVRRRIHNDVREALGKAGWQA